MLIELSTSLRKRQTQGMEGAGEGQYFMCSFQVASARAGLLRRLLAVGFGVVVVVLLLALVLTLHTPQVDRVWYGIVWYGMVWCDGGGSAPPGPGAHTAYTTGR